MADPLALHLHSLGLLAVSSVYDIRRVRDVRSIEVSSVMASCVHAGLRRQRSIMPFPRAHQASARGQVTGIGVEGAWYGCLSSRKPKWLLRRLRKMFVGACVPPHTLTSHPGCLAPPHDGRLLAIPRLSAQNDVDHACGNHSERLMRKGRLTSPRDAPSLLSAASSRFDVSAVSDRFAPSPSPFLHSARLLCPVQTVPVDGSPGDCFGWHSREDQLLEFS